MPTPSKRDKFLDSPDFILLISRSRRERVAKDQPEKSDDVVGDFLSYQGGRDVISIFKRAPQEVLRAGLYLYETRNENEKMLDTAADILDKLSVDHVKGVYEALLWLAKLQTEHSENFCYVAARLKVKPEQKAALFTEYLNSPFDSVQEKALDMLRRFGSGLQLQVVVK